MIISNVQKKLLSLFIFLGPWGTLLTPSFFPKAFRLYYLLLPFFFLFFSRTKESILRIGAIFSPFLIYCFFSALLVEIGGFQRDEDQLFRLFLLICQFLFVLGAASWSESYEHLSILIFGYLKSFFFVLWIGFGLFIGYYAGIFSLETLDRYSILTQFGYGILRISPGSYPNEFGIVCSFVLSILLLALSIDREEGSFLPKFLTRLQGVYLCLGFSALTLTTTRAAYFSFLMGLIYLLYRGGRQCIAPIFWKIVACSVAFVWICFGPFLRSIIVASIYLNMGDGSLGERYAIWLDVFAIFQKNPLFGAGFSAFSQLHNMYLALLFELGLLGTALLALTVFLFWFCCRSRLCRHPLRKEERFIQGVKTLGLIHIFWFAASNHNLHHHLTWLVFFIGFSSTQILPWKKTNPSKVGNNLLGD